MKKGKLLIALTLFLVGSCKDQSSGPLIIYVKDSVILDATSIIDFNLEKDKWLNDVLNNEKSKIYIGNYPGYYKITYPSVIFSGFVSDGKLLFLSADLANGNMFLFERSNQCTPHRVSAFTEQRIHNLFLMHK